MGDIEPIFVAARKVLLDALIALNQHADAIVLIGAQAVYYHTGSIELPIAPYTTDADVALNPAVLGVVPEIAAAMLASDFTIGSHGNPGEWEAIEIVGDREIKIPVDVMVPASMVPGRRGARLEGHNATSARRASGIEAAVIDNSWVDLHAFVPEDTRIVRCRVAGPSALIVAKAHKISDRLETGINPDRLNDKDALDLYRLALKVPASEFAPTFETLLNDPLTAMSTANGIDMMTRLFGARRSPGILMAVRSLEQTVPQARIEEVLMYLADQLAILRS